MIYGRRQPSRGGTSRMSRECQVRICERLGVQFPGPTRRLRSISRVDANGSDGWMNEPARAGGSARLGRRVFGEVMRGSA